jgi:hypothetical protein
MRWAVGVAYGTDYLVYPGSKSCGNTRTLWWSFGLGTGGKFSVNVWRKTLHQGVGKERDSAVDPSLLTTVVTNVTTCLDTRPSAFCLQNAFVCYMCLKLLITSRLLPWKQLIPVMKLLCFLWCRNWILYTVWMNLGVWIQVRPHSSILRARCIRWRHEYDCSAWYQTCWLNAILQAPHDSSVFMYVISY